MSTSKKRKTPDLPSCSSASGLAVVNLLRHWSSCKAKPCGSPECAEGRALGEHIKNCSAIDCVEARCNIVRRVAALTSTAKSKDADAAGVDAPRMAAMTAALLSPPPSSAVANSKADKAADVVPPQLLGDRSGLLVQVRMGEEWTNCSEGVSRALVNAWQTNPAMPVTIKLRDDVFSVDFSRLLLVNRATQYARSIRIVHPQLSNVVTILEPPKAKEGPMNEVAPGVDVERPYVPLPLLEHRSRSRLVECPKAREARMKRDAARKAAADAEKATEAAGAEAEAEAVKDGEDDKAEESAPAAAAAAAAAAVEETAKEKETEETATATDDKAEATVVVPGAGDAAADADEADDAVDADDAGDAEEARPKKRVATLADKEEAAVNALVAGFRA